MYQQKQVVIFGEVLFDCFPSGDEVLGGAPFNVAWHLQAFGDKPKFISRIGNDDKGKFILNAMTKWGMDVHSIQSDPEHPTGRVEVTISNNEPQYEIVKNAAYDYIAKLNDHTLSSNGILYHGSLALRNKQPNSALDALYSQTYLPIFIDVNLRDPWWEKRNIETWLHRARWAKLNENELNVLGFNHQDIKQSILAFQTQFQLEQVIVTRGELGALVCTIDYQFYHVTQPRIEHFIDTVGAGDAFTARYIHGLLCDEVIEKTIDAAQKFAIKVIGLRGAISSDPDFYQL